MKRVMVVVTGPTVKRVLTVLLVLVQRYSLWRDSVLFRTVLGRQENCPTVKREGRRAENCPTVKRVGREEARELAQQ